MNIPELFVESLENSLAYLLHSENIRVSVIPCEISRTGNFHPVVEARLRISFDKLRLYHGDFLRNMGAELWVISLSAHYHNIYVNRLLGIAPELIDSGRSDELLDFWPVISQLEPPRYG